MRVLNDLPVEGIPDQSACWVPGHTNLNKNVIITMPQGASFDMEIGKHGKHAYEKLTDCIVVRNLARWLAATARLTSASFD